MKPWELAEAELTLGVMERFGMSLSQLRAEDGDLFRLLALEAAGRKES